MTGNEFELIEKAFRRHAPFIHRGTRLGNGDDASLHTIPDNHELAISTDMSVAGVHWPEDFPLHDAARRAVNAALSDLAAMGAAAAWVWCCVSACDSEAAEAMGRGIGDALADRGIELAGGDTVHAGANALAVTVAGCVPEGRGMRRDCARCDDDVWLCGSTGLAAQALQCWQQGRRSEAEVAAFRNVTPLLDVGIALRRAGVRCCIDVSDGLLADAGHLAKASGVGIEIHVEKIPAFETLCARMPRDEALDMLLGGGEDYALLFTAPPAMRESLQGMASRIGHCTAGNEVRALLEGMPVMVENRGYNHFA